MIKRKEYLESLKKIIEKEMKSLPEGKLRVCNNKGIPRYYHITNPQDTCGTYISKKEEELPYQLAQKDYVQKLYKKVCMEIADINKYLMRHRAEELEQVYSDMNIYRKNLVTPYVIPDEIFAEAWEKESYSTNPYYPEQRVYSTKKDERVRSKSEVMLADMYYEMGIPYRYEAELVLQNGKKKYPDFTLLKVSTREIIYHEHLGLLDDGEYRENNLAKLEEYRKNGIYSGKNLILTYEAEGHYLNIKDIKKQIAGIFTTNERS
nr:hypothetical protein [Lachnospiraceae bacterium]MBQ8253819.1 hypothetical protein [Lachnospiraceae bacterium]